MTNREKLLELKNLLVRCYRYILDHPPHTLDGEVERIAYRVLLGEVYDVIPDRVEDEMRPFSEGPRARPAGDPGGAGQPEKGPG
jgi:hypothetical protein